MLEAVAIDAGVGGQPWPVETKWRAGARIDGAWKAPEWLVTHVRAVPLSSRAERDLLAAVANDDGRRVLEMASSPGEHQVAAAVIAALRLAGEYPSRALRFIEWVLTSPTDPRHLRFLRRYLPGLHVFVQLSPSVPAALPVDAFALSMLQADLLRAEGDVPRALAVVGDTPTSAAHALAITSLRLEQGDIAGALALCEGRPITDAFSAALATCHASVCIDAGDAAKALSIANAVLDIGNLPESITLVALSQREAAQRLLGRDTDAELTRSELHARSAGHQTVRDDTSRAAPQRDQQAPSPPSVNAPLYGRSVADALDDAWARVRRHAPTGDDQSNLTAAETDNLVNDIVELVRAEQWEIVENILLGYLDRIDAAIDRGEPFDDRSYVLLAGAFDKQNMPAEEVATLERLRDAYGRAGLTLPENVAERLVERRAMLDALAGEAEGDASF